MEFLAAFPEGIGQPPPSKTKLWFHQQRRFQVWPAVPGEGDAFRSFKRITHDFHFVDSRRGTEKMRAFREGHLQAAFGIKYSRVCINRNRDLSLAEQKLYVPIASGGSDHNFPTAVLQPRADFAKPASNSIELASSIRSASLVRIRAKISASA